MGELVLEMKNITKTFGSVIANQDVCLKVYAKEIHALLGENGAGKSTLMNVLTGIYRPDSGQIFCHGKEVSVNSPKDAVDLGIGMVHQHFRLIPTLTVAENISLYTEKKGFLLNPAKMQKRIAECSRSFNLEVDPAAVVWQLSVGEQQRVEIVKLLYHGAEILILDEPSAVLTPQEAQDMFNVLRKMADSGKAVIVISHKMNEVLNNADRITVLKDGRMEDTMVRKDATLDRLTRAVVGKQDYKEHFRTQKNISPDVVFSMEHVCAKNDRNLDELKDISFDIRRGEIFGIAGVAGNGQRELSEVIAGLRPVTSGKIMADGADLTRASARERREKGIALIPEDRLETGLVPDLNFSENIILTRYSSSRYSRKGFLRFDRMYRDAEDYTKEYEIRHGGFDLPVGLMSGGNQQKLLLAREVSGNPKLIVAAYPVRGLDIGAADMIRQILLQQSEKGTSVLFISEELDEIFHMCDRIGVLCDGELMGIRNTSETDVFEIGQMMAGERKNSEKEASSYA